MCFENKFIPNFPNSRVQLFQRCQRETFSIKHTKNDIGKIDWSNSSGTRRQRQKFVQSWGYGKVTTIDMVSSFKNDERKMDDTNFFLKKEFWKIWDRLHHSFRYYNCIENSEACLPFQNDYMVHSNLLKASISISITNENKWTVIFPLTQSPLFFPCLWHQCKKLRRCGG